MYLTAGLCGKGVCRRLCGPGKCWACGLKGTRRESHQRVPHPACWPPSDACLEKRTGKGKADRSLGERSPGERVGVLFASITQDASHGLRRMSAWPWPGLSGSVSAFAWAGSLEQGAGCRVSLFSSLGT